MGAYKVEFIGSKSARLVADDEVVASAIGIDTLDAILNLWSALLEQGRDELAAVVAREYRLTMPAGRPANYIATAHEDTPGDELRVRELALSRRAHPDRRNSQSSARPARERRKMCAYCFQPGDHPTPGHCLRALERS